MPATYDHPRPAVAADVVLLTSDENPRLLLIQRLHPPFQDQWALPGGFVNVGEDPQDAAARELAEETGLTGVPLEQIGAFGAPDRDPREHVISIAYLGIAPPDAPSPVAADDAKSAKWFPLDDLPALAFDHTEIIAQALQMESSP